MGNRQYTKKPPAQNTHHNKTKIHTWPINHEGYYTLQIINYSLLACLYVDKKVDRVLGIYIMIYILSIPITL